jgi:hypothetical protein
MVAEERKSTLRGQALQLSTLGKAYTHLASQHRIAASDLERREKKKITYEGEFRHWISRCVSSQRRLSSCWLWRLS